LGRRFASHTSLRSHLIDGVDPDFFSSLLGGGLRRVGDLGEIKWLTAEGDLGEIKRGNACEL
jgi:hypothetical protein